VQRLYGNCGDLRPRVDLLAQPGKSSKHAMASRMAAASAASFLPRLPERR
jgi:hypothetical protein